MFNSYDAFLNLTFEVISAKWALSTHTEPLTSTLRVEVVLSTTAKNSDFVIVGEIVEADGAVGFLRLLVGVELISSLVQAIKERLDALLDFYRLILHVLSATADTGSYSHGMLWDLLNIYTLCFLPLRLYSDFVTYLIDPIAVMGTSNDSFDAVDEHLEGDNGGCDVSSGDGLFIIAHHE